MAAPDFRAPAGWNYRLDGHSAAAPLGAQAEVERAEARCRPLPDDPVLVRAMKRAGAKHARRRLEGAPPAQRAQLVSDTDSSGASPLHWAAEFGSAKLVEALVQEGADVHAVNTAGLCALELAAMEGHTACADALAAVGSLPTAPRARAALQAVAQAPWRVHHAAPGQFGLAAAYVVFAVRRLLQPHSRVAAQQPNFVAPQRLLERLATLDAPGAATLNFLPRDESDDDSSSDDGDYDEGAVNDMLDAVTHRAADTTAMAVALAGALAAPGLAALESLQVHGCLLAADETAESWQHALKYLYIEDLRDVDALACLAMAALGDALALPGAARHVTLEFAPLVAVPVPSWDRELVASAAPARLPSAAALAQAVRAAWAQDGALRSLTLSLPRGMQLCPEQRMLLRDQARQPQHDAVTALLLGTHGRCGAHSPVRLLSAEVLRRILASCTVSVRIIEPAAV